jgi:iron(III) transport system permease protein
MTRLVGILFLSPLAGFLVEAILGDGGFRCPVRPWGYTVIVGAGAVLEAMILGIPVGVTLAHTRRSLPRTLTLFPLLLPPVLGAAAWMGARLPLPGAIGCGAILGGLYWPVVAFLLEASLRRLPADQLDAARIQLKARQTLRRVVWPHVRPALGASALLVFLLAASEFTVPALFTVPTVSMTVYEELSAFRTASAASAAIPLLALSLVLVWGLRGVPVIPPSRPSRPLPEGPYLRAAQGMAVLSWLVTSIAPALLFALRAAPSRKLISMHLDSIVWSATVAGVSALGLVLWASLSPRRSRLEPFWLALLVLPGIVAGLGTLQIAKWTGTLPWMEPSGALLVLALMSRLAFAAWFPLREPVDRAQIEAAELSGLPPFRIWWRIEAPVALPRAGAVALIVFVLALGELGPVVLLSPPGRLTLAQHLFNLMHYGYDGVVASMALFLFGASAFVTWSGMHVGRLGTNRIAQ